MSVISAAFMAFCTKKSRQHSESYVGEAVAWRGRLGCQSRGSPRKEKWGFLVTYRKILLVGEDEEDGVSELVLVEHALEFLSGLDDTVTIVGIDDEDDSLRVLEVMPPERADLVLTTDIPHGELNVLVLDGLDVETCGKKRRLVSHDGPREQDRSWDRDVPMVGMVVTISPSFSL